MSGYVRNMVIEDGEIIQLKVRKRVGERFAERDARVAAAASWKLCKHFATMRDGKWTIWPTAHHRIDTNDSIEAAWLREQHKPTVQDIPASAAEMWLRHRSK